MFRFLAAALALCIAAPVWAQGQNCAPRDAITKVLSEQHGESVQTRGLAENGAMVETWANAETGTWTAIVSLPNGMACLAAHGQAFSLVESPMEPAGQRL